MRHSALWHVFGYLLILVMCGCLVDYVKFRPPLTPPCRACFRWRFYRVAANRRRADARHPFPPNRNVIWCATLPLAWREAERVYGAPIKVAGAEEEAQRLNAAAATDCAPDARDCYAAAGRTREDIVAKIRGDMARRFSDVPDSWLPVATHEEGIVAYGYLAARMKFDTPYPQIPSGCVFTDAANHQSTVRAFGIPDRNKAMPAYLKQSALLCYHYAGDNAEPEFAVDLCRTSQPYQLVLASFPPQSTLAQTIAEVQRRIAATPKTLSHSLDAGDTLVVPEICWRVMHHFTELEGKPVLNSQGDHFVDVRQYLDFSLDRGGVQLYSSARALSIGPHGGKFHFVSTTLSCSISHDAAQRPPSSPCG